MKIKESYQFIYDKDGTQHKKILELPSDNVNIYESWYTIDRTKARQFSLVESAKIDKLPKSVSFDLSENGPFSQSYFKRIYPSVRITKSNDKADYIICDNRTARTYIKQYQYYEYYCHNEKLKNGIIQIDNLNGEKTSYYSHRILEFVLSKGTELKNKLVYINDFIDKFDGTRIKEMTFDDALSILKQVLSKSEPVRTLGAELVCGYIPKFSPITSFMLSAGGGFKINRKLDYFINRYRYGRICDVESLDEWFKNTKKMGPIDKDVNKILNKLIDSNEFKSHINYKPKHFSYSNNLQINGLDEQPTSIDEFKI